jgi:hypothetical protein
MTWEMLEAYAARVPPTFCDKKSTNLVTTISGELQHPLYKNCENQSHAKIALFTLPDSDTNSADHASLHTQHVGHKKFLGRGFFHEERTRKNGLASFTDPPLTNQRTADDPLLPFQAWPCGRQRKENHLGF